MYGSGLRGVPAEVLGLDNERFSPGRLGTIADKSGLALSRNEIASYCDWFVGADRYWVSDWRNGRFHCGRAKLCTGQIADHLSGRTSPPRFIYSLHTRAKATPYLGRPFHWTRFVAIDLDTQGPQQSSLEKRFDTCCELFGHPVVLRSPGGGLHLYWPLKEPCSVFGLTFTKRSGAPIVRDILEQAGLSVRPGNIELYPTPNHTLRLPLGGGSRQLDARTLELLPTCSREDEVRRFLLEMNTRASNSPLDPFRLRSHSAPTRQYGQSRQPSSNSSASPDIARLLSEGLHPPLQRHEACLALTRHYIITLGHSIEYAVESLMTWTRDKTNGLSREAAEMADPRVDQRLNDEYRRMCRHLERQPYRGAHGRPTRTATSTPLGEHELRLVFDSSVGKTGRDRYRFEVFLFHLLGYARDRGKRVEVPPGWDKQLWDCYEVTLSAQRVLRTWPGCSEHRYRQHMDSAVAGDLIRLSRNYRHSVDPLLCRARSYFVRFPRRSFDAPGPISRAVTGLIIEGAKAISRARVIEHAFAATERFGCRLTSRYGASRARAIRQEVALRTREIQPEAVLQAA